MEFFRNWIINIVVTMIFVTFVEILMPSGSMRKYVKFVVGLLVMMVILSPLINIATGNFDMAGKILEVSEAINLKGLQLQIDSIKKGQREGIVELYKSKLENQIERQVLDMYHAKKVKAEVRINENYGTEEFGKVLGIRLEVIGDNRKETEGVIPKVEIKVNTQEEHDIARANSNQYGELKQGICEYLSKVYGLSPEDIEVVVNKQ